MTAIHDRLALWTSFNDGMLIAPDYEMKKNDYQEFYFSHGFSGKYVDYIFVVLKPKVFWGGRT